MTRTFLIATVAALAITAPAQAQRSDREAQRAEKAEAQKAKSAKARESRGEQRARATQSRAQPSQRAERSTRASAPRTEPRQQAERRVRTERVAEPRVRASAPRAQARQQNVERRARTVETRAQTRPNVERRARAVETRRAQQRVVEQRPKAIENRARVSNQRAQAGDRQAQQRVRQQERQAARTDRVEQRTVDRRAIAQDRTIARRAAVQDRATQRAAAWQNYSGIDRDVRRVRPAQQRLVTVGQTINPDWYDDYAPVRYSAFYDNTPNYYYRYDDDDGYLYRVRRDSNLVTALFPLLGGAYSVGQQLPFYQQSYYNVPLGYRSLYYDTPDQYYRYGDGAIYQVDPGSQLIQGIVALLTGQSFGIGQQMPLGYDVYNVPYAYRSSYYDTNDMYYRYDDGYIYGFDPRTRMIQSSYPLSYGGYAVGYPVPAAYPGYDYNVPNYYNDVYYNEPGYDYRYAAGGIYQVDPSTQLVSALVALVTGQNFGVGQQMPLGYDAYNVPYAYRDRYYDTDQNMYRYADGHIYQVDPQTRMIQSVIDAMV